MLKSEEKKRINKKKYKKWPIILAIILIIVLAVSAFLYFSLAVSGYEKMNLENPVLGKSETEIIIDESYITYVLNELHFYNLHNTPLSQNTPKVEIHIDYEKYNSEVKKGNIITKKGEIENEDIRVITTKEEVIEAIKSLDAENYMTNSIKEGKTSIELVASKPSLFSKGYLNLYKELTGTSITGSIIKIFTAS